MAPHRKKVQHTVPACYLRGFLSPHIPEEHRGNPKFKPGVWVNDGTLSKPWKLRSPESSIFGESYFYNLPGDSLDRPAIEEFLGLIERRYPDILTKVVAQEQLTLQEVGRLCAFVITLQMRSKPFQENFGAQFKQVAKWHNQMTSPEHYISDESVRSSVRQLAVYLDPGAMIFEEGLHFLVTPPGHPEFVTCDAPVVHGMLHVDEVALLTGRPDLASSHARNETYACWMLAVAPHIALIASRFIIKSYASFPYIECTDTDAIFRTNIRTLQHANDFVVAAMPNPLGVHETRVSEVLRTRELPPELQGTILYLRTVRNRYVLRVDRYEAIPDGIRFWTSEREKLRAIAEDEALESLELYEEGRAVRGMREIDLQRIDPTGNTPTEICNKARLDAARAGQKS